MQYEGPAHSSDYDPNLIATLTDVLTRGDTGEINYAALEENERKSIKIAELEAENAELKPLAYTDELTGLYNRHALAKSFDAFVESSQSFGLLFIDITKFKRINDKLTHAAGDDTLRMTAEHLIQTVYRELGMGFREDDIVASDFERNDIITSRRGGDEFAVLIKYAPRGPEGEELALEETLAAISERCASQFLEIDVVKAYNEKLPKDQRLSLNIGWAAHRDDLNLDELLATADPKGRSPTYFSTLINAIPLKRQAEAGLRYGAHLVNRGTRMALASRGALKALVYKNEES